MILTIRTDKPEAELGLYEGSTQIQYKIWQAHRELSTTIHKTINELLKNSNVSWNDVTGIIYYKGPGSFTGLRIGASVANAYATTQNITCVAVNGEGWIEKGVELINTGTQSAAIPEYGGDPHITKPRK